MSRPTNTPQAFPLSLNEALRHNTLPGSCLCGPLLLLFRTFPDAHRLSVEWGPHSYLSSLDAVMLPFCSGYVSPPASFRSVLVMSCPATPSTPCKMMDLLRFFEVVLPSWFIEVLLTALCVLRPSSRSAYRCGSVPWWPRPFLLNEDVSQVRS